MLRQAYYLKRRVQRTYLHVSTPDAEWHAFCAAAAKLCYGGFLFVRGPQTWSRYFGLNHCTKLSVHTISEHQKLMVRASFSHLAQTFFFLYPLGMAGQKQWQASGVLMWSIYVHMRKCCILHSIYPLWLLYLTFCFRFNITKGIHSVPWYTYVISATVVNISAFFYCKLRYIFCFRSET